MLRIGPKIGPRIGQDGSAAAPITWDVDETSGGAFPSTEEQWEDFLAGYSLDTTHGWSAPDSLYLCQEAAGALVDVYGGFNLGSAGARQDFQVADAALTRKSVRSRGDEWFSTNAGLPDISASSYLLLTICKHETAALSTKIFLGTAPETSVLTLAGGEARLSAQGNLADSATSQVATWMPMITQLNRSTGNAVLATLDSKLVAAHGAATGKQVLIAGNTVGSGSSLYTLVARWSGAKAERTAAALKALQTALNFAPTWSP